MCRIALFNRAGLEFIHKKVGVTAFFDSLELSQGGFGNGIATLNKKRIRINKGYKLSNEDIAWILSQRTWEWGIYHTRIPTVGDKTDTNCHPFRHGSLTMAANGTESGYSKAASLLNVTDTEAVMLIVKQFKLPVFPTLKTLTSTLVGFHKGLPFAIKNSKYADLDAVYDADTNGIVFASEFPEEFKKVWSCLESFSFTPFHKEVFVLPTCMKLQYNLTRSKYAAYITYSKGYDYGLGFEDSDYVYDYSTGEYVPAATDDPLNQHTHTPTRLPKPAKQQKFWGNFKK